MIDLYVLRKIVRDFYTRNADVFQMPPGDDCSIYCCEEWGEANRAYIKAKRPQDLRRVPELNLDFRGEVGDLKFMLLATSLDEEWAKGTFNFSLSTANTPNTLDDLMAFMTYFSRVYTTIIEGWYNSEMIIQAIKSLNWYDDIEQDELTLTLKKLQKRCDKDRQERVDDIGYQEILTHNRYE